MRRVLWIVAIVMTLRGLGTSVPSVSAYPPTTPPTSGPPTTVPPVTTAPPVQSPGLSGDRQAYAPGATGTFTMTGCAAGESVSFQLYSGSGAPIGSPITAVAGADGSASVQIVLPTTPGRFYVVGTCVSSGVSARFDFTVSALPSTGADSTGALQIGVLLIGTGLLLFVVTEVRRRQRQPQVT